MKIEKYEGGGKKYVTVLADGKFHQTVDAGTEGAVIRTYENKDGVEQSKAELVFDSVTGKITKMSFEDTDFGQNLQIEIDGDGVVSLGTASPFGEDFMKKASNINVDEEVTLAPYSFTDDKGKVRKGMTVTQGGVKLVDAYYDKEAKESVGGIPQPKGDEKTSDDWKIHFLTVRKFLIKETEGLISKNNWGM